MIMATFCLIAWIFARKHHWNVQRRMNFPNLRTAPNSRTLKYICIILFHLNKYIGLHVGGISLLNKILKLVSVITEVTVAVVLFSRVLTIQDTKNYRNANLIEHTILKGCIFSFFLKTEINILYRDQTCWKVKKLDLPFDLEEKSWCSC